MFDVAVSYDYFLFLLCAAIKHHKYNVQFSRKSLLHFIKYAESLLEQTKQRSLLTFLSGAMQKKFPSFVQINPIERDRNFKGELRKWSRGASKDIQASLLMLKARRCKRTLRNNQAHNALFLLVFSRVASYAVCSELQSSSARSCATCRDKTSIPLARRWRRAAPFSSTSEEQQ